MRNGFRAVDGGGEEFLPQVGQDDADGEGFALLEKDGRLVGLIVQFRCHLLHCQPCTQANAGVVVQGARYR